VQRFHQLSGVLQTRLAGPQIFSRKLHQRRLVGGEPQVCLLLGRMGADRGRSRSQHARDDNSLLDDLPPDDSTLEPEPAAANDNEPIEKSPAVNE
jgi:hypothetical protein